MLLEVDGRLIDVDRQLMELDRADMEDSLYFFLRNAWPYIDPSPWADGWPIEAVCEHLQAVADGEIKRLVINIPPRCCKSSAVSVAFPAWLWAQRFEGPTCGPGVPLLFASYANQLSMRDSVKCRRLIESRWYQSHWGDRFKLNTDQNTKSRFGNDKGGERLITSIGGAATGEGAQCFVAGTPVATPQGPVSIENLRVGSEVYGFDHLRGAVVKSRVVATAERKSSDIYRLYATSGNSIKCTGDHPVFSPGAGYIAAGDLGPGDRLLVTTPERKLRAQNAASSGLRPMWNGIRQIAIRSAQGAKEWACGRILFGRVQPRAPRNQEHKAVRSLWVAQAISWRAVLFRCLQIICEGGKKAKARLRCLWGHLWAARDSLVNAILFPVLRGCGAFKADARGWQFQFQTVGEVFQSVPAYARHHYGARRISLRGVWEAGRNCSVGGERSHGFARAPYRPQSEEQRARKHDHALPVVSFNASQGHVASVERVQGDCAQPISVYDIQVEGCSNFFANGILVHNCIISDDPNAANEAFSEATIQTTIDWWDSTMSTRLNDPKTGAYIIIQQRLAEDDLTGHVLEKDVGDWCHLMLPMRYEWQRHSYSAIGWNDPRGCLDDGTPLVRVDENGVRLPVSANAQAILDNEREGSLLWPARFGEREVKLLEQSLGKFGAAGQLQQRPEPVGGGIVQRDWWQPWDEDAYPPMDFVVGSLDTAYTEKTKNDPSAMTVWGVFTGDAKAQATRILDQEGRPVYEGRAYIDGAPKCMLMHSWTKRLELHELVLEVAKTAKRMKLDLLLIENKAAGISVAQELRRLYSNEDFSVQLYDPKSQDKLARLYSVQHIFQEGMIYAPDTVWAEQAITQIATFPAGKNDDIVDTCSMALRHLRAMGLLTRAPERLNELEEAMRFTGNKGAEPLYPA